MVVKMSSPLDPPEELTSPPLLPAATSFVVSFDSPQPPVNSRLSNKFVKRHMRNLSLPVANVYSTNNNNTSKINNNYSNSNGVIKPPENHSEGYFSSDPEDEDKHVQITKTNTEISMSTSLDSSRLSQLVKTRQDNKLSAKSKATQEVNSAKTRSIAENGAKSRSIQENGAKDIEDEDKSDGGTYTIDQDSHEVINARLSIDRTFGITTTEHKFKDCTDEKHPSGTISPDNKDWIDEWATQVVEQNQKKASPLASPRGVLSKIPSPVYTRAKLPPTVPMNTPKTDLTPTSPPKQRTVSLSAVNIRDDCSDSSLETESYLRTTEQVVSDMFARVANKCLDSGDSDCATSHPGGLFNGKSTTPSDHHYSDSSCSETVSHSRRSLIDKANTPSSSSNKYNRAFSLRRNKNLSISTNTPSPPTSKSQDSTHPTTTSTSSNVKKFTPTSNVKTPGSSLGTRQPFSRTDCGRFSMRTPMKPPVTVVNIPSLSVPKSNPSPVPSHKKKSGNGGAARSNSTLSSREMEFQNWKRRKSYDPMKAAAEGKKGKGVVGGGKGTAGAVASALGKCDMSQSVCVPETSEPISASVLRSASFHGTRQLKAACGKSSSDDNEEDEEEEEEEDWSIPQAPKTSMETTPRGSRTSLCSLGTNSSSSNVKLKPTKIEGVDSMVITAIASMSSKLKANSSHFLRKLRVLYSEENAKYGLLSSEIERLDLADSLNNSPVKSPSRQLTATLCNLKKIENALRVMDEAIFDCEEFE